MNNHFKYVKIDNRCARQFNECLWRDIIFMIHLQNILPVIIYAVLLAIHYFLSRTGNKILGLIVPVGVITSLVYMYQADIIHMKLIGVIIIGIVALLFLAEEWHRAQKDK